MNFKDTLTSPQRTWRYWAPVAAYAVLIFYFSSLSHPEEYVPPLLIDLGDKMLHALEYGLLGVLCYRAFRYAAGPWAASHAVLLAIVLATAYGLSDELHQAFVPLREADPWDFLTDATGATVACGIWHRFVEGRIISLFCASE